MSEAPALLGAIICTIPEGTRHSVSPAAPLGCAELSEISGTMSDGRYNAGKGV